MDDQTSKVLGVMKERDFYHARVEELQKRIKVLEYDNAELVKRDAELSARCKELASKTPFKRPPRRFARG
jgi:hypothetical protein